MEPLRRRSRTSSSSRPTVSSSRLQRLRTWHKGLIQRWRELSPKQKRALRNKLILGGLSVGAATLLTYYALRAPRGSSTVAQPPSIRVEPSQNGKSVKLIDPLTGSETRVDRGQTEKNQEFEKRIIAERERLERERARLVQEQEKKAPSKYLFLDTELSLRAFEERGVFKEYFNKSLKEMKYDFSKTKPYNPDDVVPGSLILIERENTSGAKEQTCALYTPNGFYHILYPKDSDGRWMRDTTDHTGYSSSTLKKYLEETKGKPVGVFVPQIQ